MTIADPLPRDTAALLKTWIRGWAASRACPDPVADGAGWRVEVGLPEQRRRHVFPGSCATLRDHGEAIREPWVYLKACVPADEMRALLPPRWTVQAPTFFMTFDGAPPRARRLPAGYTSTVMLEDGVFHARVHAADGSLAADGRAVIVDAAAIFDRIGTEEPHRRLGLGRAVMCALHDSARDAGATHGLLAATQAGHALYTTMGWRVQAPYASAVITG